MSYRTPTKITTDIPPARKLQARKVLAAVIVAPVRLVERNALWFGRLLFVNVCVLPLWLRFPLEMAAFLLVVHVIAGAIWGLYRAFVWAENVIEEDQ